MPPVSLYLVAHLNRDLPPVSSVSFKLRRVAKGSIEEKILELQDKKRGLADTLLGGEGLDLGSFAARGPGIPAGVNAASLTWERASPLALSGAPKKAGRCLSISADIIDSYRRRRQISTDIERAAFQCFVLCSPGLRAGFVSWERASPLALCSSDRSY